MSESIIINKNIDDEGIYVEVVKQVKSLLSKQDNLVTNLANFTAILKEAFNKISWVGFYLASGDQLYLGPFQGKAACTKIQFGKGVCGTCAEKKETVIVENVDEFEGHIACDSGSKSEIVVPILYNGAVWGVLDIDSYQLNAFNRTDKKYLEVLSEFLSTGIIY